MAWTLTIDGMTNGVIAGTLLGDAAASAPEIEMVVDGSPAGTIALSRHETGWGMQAHLAPEALSSGVTVIVFRLKNAHAPLAFYPILSGRTVDTDMAAEIERMRVELAALKQAFLTDASVPKLRATDRSLIVAEVLAAVQDGAGGARRR